MSKIIGVIGLITLLSFYTGVNMHDYHQELADTIAFAQSRLDNAAVYGERVRTGRHYPADIEAFEASISEARTRLEAQGDVSYAIDELNAAIEQFRLSLIDPYNRYRPYWHTIAIGEDVPQLQHLRGIWIATVLNIDWPSVSARGTTPNHVDQQKYELRLRFDEAYRLGFNAVLFQVSPTADAFFPSDVVPWSAWLTGETNFRGELLDSNGVAFDPLQYAIDLARERHMELHAWMNPYRITHSLNAYRAGPGIAVSSSTTGRMVESLNDIRAEWGRIEGNVFNTLGEYIFLGEGRYVLDPGVPAAREWILARVMEIVNNYDIDAIHFDDYFYPSGWNDDLAFSRYNVHGLSRPDFRRYSTEVLMRDINDAIKAVAPWVKFGISPGGVWISGDGSTGYDGGGASALTGSASTTSWSNYHSSFADTRRWVLEGFIDYLTPQIYWDWSLPAAPYGAIADWWARTVSDFGPNGNLRNSRGEYATAHIYIGLGLYRMVNSPTVKWRNGSLYEYEGKRTYLRQEHYNLGNPYIMGSMVFSQNHIRPYREGGLWETMTELRGNAWRYPALVPPMPHLGGVAPNAPVGLSVDSGQLTWFNGEPSQDQLRAASYFVIFASDNPDIEMIPANIYTIIRNDGSWRYTIELSREGYFGIIAANRVHDLSDMAVTGGQ